MAKSDDYSTLRPSRDERAPYIDAINQAMAEGRIEESDRAARESLAETATSFRDLDALVVDIPFTWHDAELEKAKLANRRRFLTGAGTLAALAAVSFISTRTWVRNGPEASAAAHTGSAADAATATSAPGGSGRTPEEGTLPTTLVTVTNWQKDTMRTAVDYALSVGVVRLQDAYSSDDTFRIEGATKKGEPTSIFFQPGYQPQIEKLDLLGKTIPIESVRDLDVEKLHKEAMKASDLGSDLSTHVLDIAEYSGTWEIQIRGASWDTSVAWSIGGKRRITLPKG